MKNKIWVVAGCIDESGDYDWWIKELFTDEEQAAACCEYFNLTKKQKNIWYEYYDTTWFCEKDYISKLKEIKNNGQQ